MPRIKTTAAQFSKLLDTHEGTTLEFKEAARSFSLNELIKHCGAIYNTQHGKGHVILGATDQTPHQVRGTSAFPNLGDTEKEIYEKLNVFIEIEEYHHKDGRVLILHVPEPRDGELVGHQGKYYIRRGASSVLLSHEEIRDSITASAKAHLDYSAQLVDATFSDLVPDLVDLYLEECSSQQPNNSLFSNKRKTYLQNIGLMVGDQLTVAALVLLGSGKALRCHLPAMEICYIYKTDKQTTNKSALRLDCKTGVWEHLDILWDEINKHNVMQNYQHKLARKPIPTFDEDTIRETIINAVAHRDYTISGGIYIRQFPTSIEITSPGGFLAELDPEHLEYKSFPRNHLLTEAFQRAGRADRAGSGIAMMNRKAIAAGKPLPDYSTSDRSQVCAIIDGKLVSEKLAEYIHHSPSLQDYPLSTQQYRVLCAISTGEDIADEELKTVRKKLLQDGIIKSQGSGRSVIYSLAMDTHIPYELFNGHREAIVDLLNIIVPAAEAGVSMSILSKSITSKTKDQLRRILQFMARDGLVKLEGKGRGSVWVATLKGADLLHNEQPS